MSVLAFAGRRTDANGAVPSRFPFENVPRLGAVLRGLLLREEVDAVVSSAACGADLVLLSEAATLGLRRRVVLPFGAERFRRTSVTDRPHPEVWGALFDAAAAAAATAGDLVDLGCDAADTASYSAANAAIVEEALALAAGPPPRRALAAIACDSIPRAGPDATRHFADLARAAGLPVFTISTLDPSLPGEAP